MLVWARDPVLLDDEPALVAAGGELVEEGSQVDVASAELGEDAAAPRLGHVGPVGEHALEDVAAVVLHVHVRDPLAPVPQTLDRIAAAEREVAGVQHEGDVRPRPVQRVPVPAAHLRQRPIDNVEVVLPLI